VRLLQGWYEISHQFWYESATQLGSKETVDELGWDLVQEQERCHTRLRSCELLDILSYIINDIVNGANS